MPYSACAWVTFGRYPSRIPDSGAERYAARIAIDTRTADTEAAANATFVRRRDTLEGTAACDKEYRRCHRTQNPYTRAGLRRPRSAVGMGLERANGSHWFYAYFPQGIAGGATSALIPLFAYGLGGSLSDVGIIAAATSIASVPSFMLWGSLSDRVGRRKVFLLIGFAGNALCFLLMAASRTLPEFYLTNLLIGCLGAASGPVGTVLIMETTPRTEWPARLAFVSRIGALGWVGGLGLGVAWLALGPALAGGGLGLMRALFAIGAGFGGVSVMLAFLWTREPIKRVSRKDVQGTYVRPRVERGRYLPTHVLHYFDLRTPRAPAGRLPRPLRRYLFCVFLLFGGFTAFYSFFPIFLTQVYPISSAGVFALAFVLHAGVGLCWAVLNVAGSTWVSHLAPAKGRAQAFGAYNAVQGVGSILGPLLGGFSAQW